MSSFDRNSNNDSDVVSNTSSHILKRTRKNSIVKNPLWDHFTLKNEEIVCNYCIPEKKFSSKTATINFKYHLEHKHSARFQELESKLKHINNTNTDTITLKKEKKKCSSVEGRDFVKIL